MGKAQIKTEKDFEAPPPASQPEKAWLKDGKLFFNIHVHDRRYGCRVDTPEMFELGWIVGLDAYLGPNGGFKGIVIKLDGLEAGAEYKISKSHTELAREIWRLLEQSGKLLTVKRVRRKKRKN